MYRVWANAAADPKWAAAGGCQLPAALRAGSLLQGDVSGAPSFLLSCTTLNILNVNTLFLLEPFLLNKFPDMETLNQKGSMNNVLVLIPIARMPFAGMAR